MNTVNQLSVLLYSDANFLAVNILENLLAKGCFVNVVTSDPGPWRERTKMIRSRSHFAIVKNTKDLSISSADYCVFCGGFIKSQNAFSDFNKFMRNENIRGNKTLAVFPFEIFSRKETFATKVRDNVGIVYLGDLIGPRIDLESDLTTPTAIAEILTSRELKVSVGEIFRPVFVADASRAVTKWLFSFGPYGKESFLLGSEISATLFWKENQKLIKDLKLVTKNTQSPRFVPGNYETQIVACDLPTALRETYKWISRYGYVSTKRIKQFKPPKYFKHIAIFLSVILILPILLLIISTGGFLLAYKSFMSGHTQLAENEILISKTFAVLGKGASVPLGYVPLLGRIYKETEFVALMQEDFSDIFLRGMPLMRTSTDLFTKVLGNEIYDPTPISGEMSGDLDAINRDIALIQIDVESAVESKIFLANYLNKKVDLAHLRKLAEKGKIFTDNLPQFLGKGPSKTYLVLFQNNMELRPTGGFIGSYGLATFDGGRLNDLTISDVYSADGQLNGHVEPPAPIKNYLGEANWWLRDSNWDPDFPTSAQRAEWFLGKELGKDVDGVFAIDLAPVKEALKTTGSIFLADYNMDISSENLYEKTQSEVQDQFFPGTHKKASFLTALSRELLAQVTKMTKSGKVAVVKNLFDALEGRHVQAYLHGEALQSAVSGLGWDGAFDVPSCGAGCYPDFVGDIEANVGVNKANYFVDRKLNLDISIGEKEITRSLNIILANSANPALGVAGKYKSFVRVAVPVDSVVLSVQSDGQELSPETTEVKGRKEVGVPVEVFAGQTKELMFSWKTDVTAENMPSSYGIYVRKQGGTEADPLTIRIKKDAFGLTGEGVYRYNTELTRDFFSRIYW